MRSCASLSSCAKKELIDITDATFQVVPAIAKDALERLKVEDGKLSHINFRRDRIANTKIEYSVFLSGSRANKRATYDATGSFVKEF